jgi:LacI family transcriptional regulator
MLAKPSKTHHAGAVAHPYRVREIAAQSGLSEATVDRVLNRRGGVRASTVEEVHQAIEDLDRQRTQIRPGGRTFLVDVVAQAPERFTSEIRRALEAELPLLHPAVIRARFTFRQSGSAADLAEVIRRIGARGTQGVILKVPEVVEAVQELVDRGIPVVTLVTDLPASGRVAYVGIDNRAAGATAAYLVQQWLGDRPGSVLVTLSSSFFRGEEEREMGFRATMRALQPERGLVDISESDGLDVRLHDLVVAALDRDPTLIAVYSIGGGNLATVQAFGERQRNCSVFVGHDLDHDNRRLLRQGDLSAVLHHDLNQDMRRSCQLVLQAQNALPGPVRTAPAAIQVVTPYNVPGTVPAIPSAAAG